MSRFRLAGRGLTVLAARRLCTQTDSPQPQIGSEWAKTSEKDGVV
jgi:hypothetical protein